MYDSPQQHPRISDDEKNYIMDNIAKSVNEEETQIPWKSIILSGPVWLTIAAHWSSAWGFLTLMTQAPTYFNFVHGWNINTVSYAFRVYNLVIIISQLYYIESTSVDWIIIIFFHIIIIQISIIFSDWDPGRNTAHTQNHLLVLLFHHERLVATYEATELDECQKIGHLRLYCRSRYLHHSSRI